MAHKSPRAAQPANADSAAVKGGSAAPHRKGKDTNFISKQIKPNKKVYQHKKKSQDIKKTIWGTPNKFSHQPRASAQRQSLSSCFVLKNNSNGAVVAKYIGSDRNIYLNSSIWVPKFLVTDMLGDINQGTKIVL